MNIVFISSLFLFFSSLYFAITYYKKLKQLNEEFNKKKYSIEMIIDNYLRSIKKQERIVEKLNLNFEFFNLNFKSHQIS